MSSGSSGSALRDYYQQQQQQQHMSAACRVTTAASGAKYMTTHHHQKIETVGDGGGGGGDGGGGGGGGGSGGDGDRESSGSVGEEDVLHVVTNVYTIPIVKSTESAGSGGGCQEIHISTSSNDEHIRSSGLGSGGSNRRVRERHEHVFGISEAAPAGEHENDCVIVTTSPHSQPHVEMQTRKTCRETRKITKRVIDEPGGSPTPADVTRSKFQIRSIVEIYENPIEQQQELQQSLNADQSTGFYKTSTQLNEVTTKETFSEPLLSQRGTAAQLYICVHICAYLCFSLSLFQAMSLSIFISHFSTRILSCLLSLLLCIVFFYSYTYFFS